MLYGKNFSHGKRKISFNIISPAHNYINSVIPEGLVLGLIGDRESS
jgi:hypothetical protein